MYPAMIFLADLHSNIQDRIYHMWEVICLCVESGVFWIFVRFYDMWRFPYRFRIYNHLCPNVTLNAHKIFYGRKTDHIYSITAISDCHDNEICDILNYFRSKVIYCNLYILMFDLYCHQHGVSRGLLNFACS